MARHNYLIFGVVLLMLAASAAAQSISIASPGLAQPFALNQDPTSSQTLTINSSGRFLFWRTVRVCVYMTAPLTGTVGNPDNIPYSDVQVNGSSIVSGANNCGIQNATLVSATNTGLGFQWSRTDSISMRIAGYPSALSPDTYGGTINLIAAVY